MSKIKRKQYADQYFKVVQQNGGNLNRKQKKVLKRECMQFMKYGERQQALDKIFNLLKP